VKKLDDIIEQSCILVLQPSQNNFALVVRTDADSFAPILQGDVEMVIKCKEKYEASLRYAMRHYAKALESFVIIKECSTDPCAAAEAKDRLDD
jgi:hypothetical protein